MPSPTRPEAGLSTQRSPPPIDVGAAIAFLGQQRPPGGSGVVSSSQTQRKPFTLRHQGGRRVAERRLRSRRRNAYQPQARGKFGSHSAGKEPHHSVQRAPPPVASTMRRGRRSSAGRRDWPDAARRAALLRSGAPGRPSPAGRRYRPSRARGPPTLPASVRRPPAASAYAAGRIAGGRSPPIVLAP